MIKELKELWADAPVSRRIGAIAMSLVVLIVGIWAVNINWPDQNTTGPGATAPGLFNFVRKQT
jgi:hypothetical protein